MGISRTCLVGVAANRTVSFTKDRTHNGSPFLRRVYRLSRGQRGLVPRASAHGDERAHRSRISLSFQASGDPCEASTWVAEGESPPSSTAPRPLSRAVAHTDPRTEFESLFPM